MSTNKNVVNSNISRKTWNVEASNFAKLSINPTRNIIERLNLEPNPKKYMIPLSIGKKLLFFNISLCKNIFNQKSFK